MAQLWVKTRSFGLVLDHTPSPKSTHLREGMAEPSPFYPRPKTSTISAWLSWPSLPEEARSSSQVGASIPTASIPLRSRQPRFAETATCSMRAPQKRAPTRLKRSTLPRLRETRPGKVKSSLGPGPFRTSHWLGKKARPSQLGRPEAVPGRWISHDQKLNELPIWSPQCRLASQVDFRLLWCAGSLPRHRHPLCPSRRGFHESQLHEATPAFPARSNNATHK